MGALSVNEAHRVGLQSLWHPTSPWWRYSRNPSQIELLVTGEVTPTGRWFPVVLFRRWTDSELKRLGVAATQVLAATGHGLGVPLGSIHVDDSGTITQVEQVTWPAEVAAF